MTYIIGLTGSIACGKSTVCKRLCSLMEQEGLLKKFIDCDQIAHLVLEENNEYFIMKLKEFLVAEGIDVDVETLLDYDTAGADTTVETTNERVEETKENDLMTPTSENASNCSSSGRTKGQINRIRLGSLIFRYPNLRRRWNSLIQPKIFKKIVTETLCGYSWKGLLPLSKQDLILIDMPLLFETTGAKYVMKRTICVSVSDEKEQLRRLLERNPYLSIEEAESRIKSQIPSAKKEEMCDYVIRNNGDLKELETEVDKVYKRLKMDLGF